jgi:ribokinase
MSGRIPKVVVMGGTYVDMVIRCDHVPSPGQSIAGSGLSYTATGPGPNQAAEAALCGCQVHLISKVGGDLFAQIVKTSLADFDVNADVVVTLVDAKGENAILKYTGANSALQPQDINDAEQIISEANVCLIHGQLPQDAVTAAIRCAKVHGVKVILNPARPLAYSGVEAGLEQPDQQSDNLPIDYFSADILIPNLYEAADITDQSAANIHSAKLIGSDLVARSTGAAVITMGRRGCMVVDRNGADHISSFEVDLVDQTGRGDAFAGALAACCAVGDDLRKAVKFASAAGALACTKFGSLEALPSKADIIELLQKQDVE